MNDVLIRREDLDIDTYRRKVANYKPRRDFLKETNPADTLI